MAEAAWFAGRLRELRESRGLSQPALAQLAGMSKGGVSDLEQGRRKPTWESVLSLAGALGVSTDEFAKEPGHHQSRPQGRPIKRKPAGSEEAGITPPIEEAKPKRPRGRPRKESQAEQSETPPTTPKLRGKKGPSA